RPRRAAGASARSGARRGRSGRRRSALGTWAARSRLGGGRRGPALRRACRRAGLAARADGPARRAARRSRAHASHATPARGAARGAAPAAPPKPADARWWHQPGAGPTLRRIWAQGRSGTAQDAARDVLGLNGLDPAVLASAVEKQLSYNAPEAPPPTQRPDYK